MKDILLLVAKGIGWLILAAVIVVVIYASFIQEFIFTAMTVPEATFYVEDNETATITLIQLHKNKDIEIYTLIVGGGEIVGGMKTEAVGEYCAYNHFFADYYFTGDTIFSVRKIDLDGTPGTLVLDVKSAVAVDYVTLDSSDATSSAKKSFVDNRFQISIDKDIFYIGDKGLKKVDEIPNTIKSYIEKLDNESAAK